MNKQYLWAKIAIVAVLSAASSAAWAGNCYFTGGHYDASPDTNTLYLESFADEGAEVVLTNQDAQCINNNRNEATKVVIRRDTPLKSTSTLVIPVRAQIDTSLCFKVYDVGNFSKVDGKWTIVAADTSGLVQQNRPVIVRLKTEKEGCQDLMAISMRLISASETPDNETTLRQYLWNSNSGQSNFYLAGTYKYKKWESGASGIDKVYGYAARDKGGVSGGQFVKIGSGAFLPPLRAYLEYRGEGLAKKSSDNGDDFELPETIEVRLVDSDGTMSIGKLNPVTGEIQMDSRRFDLNGRAINGKPANHGVYVNKKKAVR
jgi:hypothetical protein